jgi:plastocyanin domain-containing protein
VNSSNTAGAVQDIYIKALSDGTYDKQELDVRKGETVRLHFTADPSAGCGRSMVVYGLNIRASSLNGEESVVEFIPQQAGSYEISCGMRMWGPAKLVVS